MRLYNTLTRSEEAFAPGGDNTVRMYTCGLTVYARGHIGNFRTFVCLDVLRRTLKYRLGYNVKQVMNFTAVDDRTIAGAQKAGMDLRSYTDQHIECSAMALRLLGPPPIDIHAGGVDLIFPHHEHEIAQSEGATIQLLSRFWVHVEYLIVDDQKMSKSLGNTYTIRDVVSRGYRPSAVRYLLLSTHYRKQLNFTWTSLDQTDEALRRLTDFLARLDAVTR